MIKFPWQKTKKQTDKSIIKDHLKREKQVSILFKIAKKKGFSRAVEIALQLEDPWVMAELRKEARTKKRLVSMLRHL